MHPRAKIRIEGKQELSHQVKILDSLWLMKYTKNITAGLDVKLNKSSILYHCIRSFINVIQGENDPNDTFKVFFRNIYETMDISGRDNILCSKQLTKNGNQESMKEKQAKIYQIKAICFLVSSDHNRYSLLLNPLRERDNVGKGEYPVTTTSARDILIRTECGIRGNQQSSTYKNRGGRIGRQ